MATCDPPLGTSYMTPRYLRVPSVPLGRSTAVVPVTLSGGQKLGARGCQACVSGRNQIQETTSESPARFGAGWWSPGVGFSLRAAKSKASCSL
eukprot:601932-Rhodomonas_salina.1